MTLAQVFLVAAIVGLVAIALAWREVRRAERRDRAKDLVLKRLAEIVAHDTDCGSSQP